MTKSLRAKQTAETRRALVKAGSRLFGAKGFATVSTTEIVERAGVTRGALYHHFPDGKVDLFHAVVEEMQIQLVEAMESAYDPASPAAVVLNEILNAYFLFAENKHFNRVIFQDGPAALGYARWRELDRKYSMKFLRERIAELQAREELIKVPADMLASVLFGAVCEASLAMFAAPDKSRAKAEAIEVISTLALGLLKKP